MIQKVLVAAYILVVLVLSFATRASQFSSQGKVSALTPSWAEATTK